jgi:hypothetical protein
VDALQLPDCGRQSNACGLKGLADISCRRSKKRRPFKSTSAALFMLGGSDLYDRVRSSMENKKGQEELRWKELEGLNEIRRRLTDVLPEDLSQQVRIWARVRLGGERSTDLAQEYGYRDGSGIYRVVQRLENKKVATLTSFFFCSALGICVIC